MNCSEIDCDNNEGGQCILDYCVLNDEIDNTQKVK